MATLAGEVEASSVHLSGDWSRHALRRLDALREALAETAVEVHVHEETLTVVPPGVVVPDNRDHFAVFTPYHRRWSDRPMRPELAADFRLASPPVRRDGVPSDGTLCQGETARHLPEGGESAGRRRVSAWLTSSVADYEERHDDLPGDATSRLSPYLHFGCVSPVSLVAHAGRSKGAQAFVRQLAWRDFHLQVLAARPDAAQTDFRDRGDRWREDADDLLAWQEGRTGYPVIDAAMRQLSREGWMHNRARLLVGSFLTKTLYLDWRHGARHFLHHLVDGEISNNQLNWQWVAGTGTDSRPNRVLNPLTQADRHDRHGDYVRRYVPELADIEGGAVHRPWKLPDEIRSRLDYPEPIVDLAVGRHRFLEARDR